MVSVGHHSFNMLQRHMGEGQEQFGSIYPDPPQGAFSAAPPQPAFSSAAMDLSLTSDAYYPRIAMPGFEQSPFVNDGPAGWSYGGGLSPPMFQEDREMGVPSNMSTTSAPSAPSSAVGSPRSTHGQPAPVPDWAHQGVMSPGIVGSHEYYAGTEYSFAPPGMEDLAPFAYADATKPPGFVGEFPQTSTVAPEQQQQQSLGPLSPCVSRRDSSCTFSSEPGPTVNNPSETVYAQTVMSSLLSPESSRNPSMFASPDTASSSSPTAPVWTSPTAQVSSFFSQSSGHFIAPLGSSCWFSLLGSFNLPNAGVQSG